MPAELELKLEIDPADVDDFLKLANSLAWKKTGEQLLANSYFDTPDQALKRDRIALRVRKAGERWRQTLKTAGTVDASGISRRGEWEWELQSGDLDLALAAARLPANLDSSKLMPLFSTDFKRTTWLVEQQGTQVEVALDIGEISAANRTVPISEVELELKEGDAQAILSLAELLKQHVELRVSTVSKAERAQRLLDGEV